MIALEALAARHGDCLLLHWGTVEEPRIALIDGGPDGTYARTLRPRLAAIGEERQASPLRLDLVMVSHIDDDHIGGLLELADDIEAGDAPASIALLWFNSLEDLVGRPLPGAGARPVAAAASSDRTADDREAKVLASVPQGQYLHGFAKRQGLLDTMNAPCGALVAADADAPVIDIEGLRVTVVCPRLDDLSSLKARWEALRKGDATAAYRDRSPYNLSSIVVLVEHDGRRLLLTGDARGDIILDGLQRLGLLQDGGMHVDVVKLPHHGSDNNVDPTFFERLTADAYVVSGDHERFMNPGRKAMSWLAAARGDAPYTVHCTYDLAHMRDIFGDRLRVPQHGATSVTVSFPDRGPVP